MTKWLEFEINGYPIEKGKYLGEILGTMGNPKAPLLKKALNRQVEAQIHMLVPGRPIETFPFPIIVSYPLFELEEQIDKIKGKPGKITSQIPASNLPGAVDILKRPPDELVPFEVSQWDYELIPTKIKQELLQFIMRAARKDKSG